MSPVKETYQRKFTPRKVIDIVTGPQTFQVQSQSEFQAQSVMAVSPLANVVTSPIQSTAAPHPASIATVFREMDGCCRKETNYCPHNGQN